MVTCQLPGSEDGVVCVIDEQTLSISNTLKVGKQPRGITLDRQRQHLLVANYGSDSITVIDQMGTKVLATLPTAGRPLAANVSWSDPQDIVISLKAGGVLQRMDASHFPPVLSGLTALRKPSETSNSLVPACALPIGEDNLWIVPDRTSESLALVVSNEQELKQIGFYSFGASEPSETGLGQVAISRHGLQPVSASPTENANSYCSRTCARSNPDRARLCRFCEAHYTPRHTLGRLIQ